MHKNSKIDRRQFLKATATVAAAVGFPYIIPSSAAGAAGTVAPSNRIVMGAIGVGSMGTGDMKGFLLRDNVQMVAVCDVDRNFRDRAKRNCDEEYQNSDCKTYLDFRELIGRGDLDAVMLALPDHWHGVIAVAAAKAGLDIHAQKPLARTISEGRAICDAVKRYGVVWQTGSQQRSRRNFHRACELVRNGRIARSTALKLASRMDMAPELRNFCRSPKASTGICGLGRHRGDHIWISVAVVVTGTGDG